MNAPANPLGAMGEAFVRLASPAGRSMPVVWSADVVAAPGHGLPSLDEVRALAESRLDRVTRLRQRPAPTVYGLGEPDWVDDPAFSVEHHIEAFPATGQPISARRWARLEGRLLSTPLSRHRPPWHLALARIEGEDRLVLLCRMHPALAGGMAARELALLLLDTGPTQAPARAGRSWSPARAPSGIERSALAAARGMLGGVRSATALRHAAEHPRSALGAVEAAARDLAVATRRELLPTDLASRGNSRALARRELVRADLPLAALARAGREHGASVAETTVALVAGALRDVLDEPPKRLRALVPLRGGADALVVLPLAVTSPEARLRRIREQMARARAVGSTVRMPAAVADLAIAGAAASAGPLYLLGGEVRAVHPGVPLAGRQPLAVGTVSLGDRLLVGVHIDPLALPEARELPGALRRQLHLLRPGRFARGAAGPGRPEVVVRGPW